MRRRERSLAQLGILVSEEKRRAFLKIRSRGQKKFGAYSKGAARNIDNSPQNPEKLPGFVSLFSCSELGFC